MGAIKKEILELVLASSKGRRSGKTFAICKAAKEIGAIVITANKEHAKLLEREYGIIAIPYKGYSYLFEGNSRPILFDHFTVEEMLLDYADMITILEGKVNKLEERLNDRY